MQKGQTQVLILAGIVLVLALAGGIFYIGRVSAPKPQAPVAIPSPQPSPTPPATTLQPSAPSIEEIAYKPNSSWQTYTDSAGKFAVQYPANYKLSKPTPGKEAEFLSCVTSPDKGEVCLRGYVINIESYDGGSRRQWFDKKFPNFLFKPFYQDVLVAETKALIIMDGNTGGSTGSFILVPRRDKMYLFNFPDGWNPETGDKASLSFIKQVLSTFKFLP